ncbi:MAG TPA: M23 family metallopeptidase, partial [Chitinophagaceae bacterium]|nr:M23 family metallopeptidase [Chitinophagaceae bacterium]
MHKVVTGYLVLFIFILYIFSSCHPGKKGIFGTKKSAHSRYAESLEKAGLKHTAMVIKWQLAAQKSLAEPIPVTIPHKEAGYFSADDPRAAGYRLTLQQGVNLEVSLDVVSSTPKTVFLELWKTDTAFREQDLLAESDSTSHLLYEVEDDGLYIIRIQPELLASMEFTLTVTKQASLAFPVSEIGKPTMISFWNDKRDAGRNHEGVDISAPFRTPAIAAANGYIRNVTENRLGGKVIFLRPEGKNYSLYYAHLDTQLVSPGQTVMKGQPVGLVGNTGNAINTTPHLHFGIYTRGGAVDPLPFIDNRIVQPKNITASRSNLNKWVRAIKNTKVFELIDAPADTSLSIQRGT